MKQRVLWLMTLLALSVALTGCGQGQAGAAPSAPVGALGAKNAGTAQGTGASASASGSGASKVISPAEAEAVKSDVQQVLTGIDQDLQAVEPDSEIDPNAAASGF